jgi:hypothetical protein
MRRMPISTPNSRPPTKLTTYNIGPSMTDFAGTVQDKCPPREADADGERPSSLQTNGVSVERA